MLSAIEPHVLIERWEVMINAPPSRSGLPLTWWRETPGFSRLVRN
jgi:hypothetical protein